ncbi:hypothetical protein [Nonlabens marinus]|uniref:DUF4258 domain-containing protein n=1 Tax=Nonlabens marinus S1-08 TaxID=1454201 RepID=W8VWD9_9FLAO|nr:hypothetical protein [Nonlabens marinus]BAO56238.1 hypothetical protein NMS_2229 [Nonlabens marinus S1-08]
MDFIKRLGFYMGGFAIGLVFLIFFLSGKRAQCNWFPEDRVIADIGKKSIRLSPEVRENLKNRELDTLSIQMILKYGDVDFAKSNTDTVPCNRYYINGRQELAKTALIVTNCERYARVEKMVIE